MEKNKNESDIINRPHSGDSDSDYSDEEIDLRNLALPSSDLSESIEDFSLCAESQILDAKKRPLTSSGSESGSAKRDIKQELKKSRTESRHNQLDKHRDIVGTSKPTYKPIPPRPQQPAKTPISRPVVPQTKTTQVKPNTPQKRSDNLNMSPNPAGASTAGVNEVEEYEVEELNTEKISINNLCAQPTTLAVFSTLVKKDNIHKLQSFLLSGKKFSDAIKRARLSGKKFMRYENILINIQTDPKNITTMDFTKQRFLAACHKQLFESGLAPNFCSPLVTRVIFDDENPLTAIKPLLGAGFQFAGEVLKQKFGEKDAILLFHLGCFVLDYIRMTTAYKNPTTGQLMNPTVL